MDTERLCECILTTILKTNRSVIGVHDCVSVARMEFILWVIVGWMEGQGRWEGDVRELGGNSHNFSHSSWRVNILNGILINY